MNHPVNWFAAKPASSSITSKAHQNASTTAPSTCKSTPPWDGTPTTQSSISNSNHIAQKNVGSKDILGQKNFGSKKILGQKKFVGQIFFDPKTFMGQKIFRSKKNLNHKIF